MPEPTHSALRQDSEAQLAALQEEVRQLREEQERLRRPQQTSLDTSPGDNGGTKFGAAETPPKRSRKGLIILLVVLAAITVGSFFWWRYAQTYESTDDAQVSTHLSGLGARVAGTVTAVYAEENQFVRAGQVIAELDPRDYQIALEQARGRLTEAQAQVRAENPGVPITRVTNLATVTASQADIANAEAAIASAEREYEAARANLVEAEANFAKAQADVERYRPLAEKDEIPRQQFDHVVAAARAQAALVDSRRASAAASQKVVDQRRTALEQARIRSNQAQQNAPYQLAISEANIVTREAAVKTAQAQVARAEQDLAYCEVIAPVSGIVSRRTVEVGQRVNAGQQMLQIAQINDLWVTANFKETQLHQMRPGQRVTIHVDAFDQDFNGTVESMPASTGSITSLLPPENATGNYVKVVQRLPVRIRFQAGQRGLDRLRPGMSVVPTVWLE